MVNENTRTYGTMNWTICAFRGAWICNLHGSWSRLNQSWTKKKNLVKEVVINEGSSQVNSNDFGQYLEGVKKNEAHRWIQRKPVRNFNKEPYWTYHKSQSVWSRARLVKDWRINRSQPINGYGRGYSIPRAGRQSLPALRRLLATREREEKDLLQGWRRSSQITKEPEARSV